MKLILILLVLYILSQMGRTGHPGVDKLKGWNYAHRGLHRRGVPENSLAAFHDAVAHGYGAELDVHLLKDGNLAVIHDSDLKRVTGREGRVEDLTTEELKDYHLLDTDQTIPTFAQVLEVFGGKTPLIVELKPKNNTAALCEAACAAMEGYPGVWCMESFDPRVVYWLKKHRPDIVRGQLSENSILRKDYGIPLPLRVVTSLNLTNFLTRPDFIAYKYRDRKNPSNWICRKIWGIQGVSWTLKTPEEHRTAEQEGWIPIFEDYEP